MAGTRSPTKPKRRPRGSLSSEEILTKAQELIERDGFDGFSMPALAREIGCGVMTIYWYFRNKEELIIAVAQRVTAEVHDRLPPLRMDVPWHEAYRERLAGFRQEFLVNRTFVEIFVAQRERLNADPKVAALVADSSKRTVDLLVSAGFTPDEARKIHLLCIGFIRGYVLHEHPWVPGALGDGKDHADSDQPRYRADPQTPTGSPFDDDLFDFSLDLLITGMQAKLAARPAKKKPAARRAKSAR
jgi:AcrR family transcriptional regulator